MLTIGIPKEIKPLEKRVAMTPAGTAELIKAGAKVCIQSGAGMESGFSDTAYAKAGAELLPGAAPVYAKADLILKVKEPLEPEFALLKPGQAVFSFLHLASPENGPLIQVLKEKKITAIAYETLQEDGRLPLLAPMSVLAGSLSVAYASFFKNGDIPSDLTAALAKVAAGYPDFKGLGFLGNVVIWGGGTAGQAALETAIHLGAHVTVIEKNPDKRALLQKWTGDVHGPEENVTGILEEADVFIGSVHVRGMRAPRVMPPDKLAEVSRKKKKIIMDISIDQGGNFPESRPSSYSEPVFTDASGNLRFCVANIPSLAGRAAAEALAKASLPYVLQLVRGIDEGLKNPVLAQAVNVRGGRVLLPEIGLAQS